MCPPPPPEVVGSVVRGIFGCHNNWETLQAFGRNNPVQKGLHRSFLFLFKFYFIFNWRIRYESESRSVMSDSVTPWTVAHQAPLSMEFSRQEY